ncbi:hypothetical protein RvY_08688-1 [Ramazzottius varieornatus]|uniref:Uncharacterized protein n=1 Tax=Ramazzottius varieornatus TaxID=947166 RepID=A0A1D1VCA9_RAMVA|nr:hypothetical protein RvY_08688-1 [Ramazzottius varieornatus]
MFTSAFAGFRIDILARLAMVTTKDASFETGYEGVVIKRDELEDALTNARESATSVNAGQGATVNVYRNKWCAKRDLLSIPSVCLRGKQAVAEPLAAAAETTATTSVKEMQEAVDEVRDNAAEDKAGQEGSTTTMSKKQKKAAKKAAAKLEKAAEHTSAEVSQKTGVSAASVQEPKKEEVNEEQGAKMEEKVEKPAENGTKKTEEKAEEKNPAQNGTKVEEEEKKKEKTNEPPKAKEPGQLESILPNGFIPSTHHAMGYLLERIKWGREDVSSAE